MSALDDGVYDAFVVSANTRDDGDVTLELVITAGTHKGELLRVNATAMRRDALAIIGLPCALVVRDGEPFVTLES